MRRPRPPKDQGRGPTSPALPCRVRRGREEPPQTRFDRLLHGLAQYGLARPETVPLWAALLSLPTTDRFPPLSLPATRQREETLRTMLEWLHARAARRPVLFVVEDLHW